MVILHRLQPEGSVVRLSFPKGVLSMKKDQTQKVKKLHLNRETLCSLAEGKLQVVAGGATLICTERCTGVSCYC
jgi:hypothetical protein